MRPLWWGRLKQKERTMFELHLDMDGVLVDLYAQPWREAIAAESVEVFLDAAPLVDTEELRKHLRYTRKLSGRVVINTHTPEGASKDYQERVRLAKVIWLAEHIGLDSFDRFVCTPYGTDKTAFITLNSTEVAVVDDNPTIREQFKAKGHQAMTEKDLFEWIEAMKQARKDVLDLGWDKDDLDDFMGAGE